MKAFLMFKYRNFDLQQELPWNAQALLQDLELNVLFKAMAHGDDFVCEIAKRTLLSSLRDADTILYRQNVLKDCLKNPTIIKDIYKIAVESLESKKGHYYDIFSIKYPSSILYSSVKLMEVLVGMLKRLKAISDEHAHKFDSEGFTSFFSMLDEELDDEYFEIVQNHLRELRLDHGVLISAELGKGNKGSNYILRKSKEKKQRWIKRIFAKSPPSYSFYINDRDVSGATMLSRLKDRGLNSAANALAQSADHVLGFFRMLRTELAFYVGCLNLHEKLTLLNEPMSFPQPQPLDERKCSFNELYDICLALSIKRKIVGNDLNTANKEIFLITGANQGGKSTYLRSIGISQLMMQCGMYTPAESFSSNLCNGLFTHYKREEDTSMKSGKLDEELSRMSDIVDHVKSNSILLFNESFAATNEREGSEIAGQIICALKEKQIRVFFVTHLYEFAHKLFEKRDDESVFLRAERQTDGERTFKVIEGEPLETSYGEDVYRTIWTVAESV